MKYYFIFLALLDMLIEHGGDSILSPKKNVLPDIWTITPVSEEDLVVVESKEDILKDSPPPTKCDNVILYIGIGIIILGIFYGMG